MVNDIVRWPKCTNLLTSFSDHTMPLLPISGSLILELGLERRHGLAGREWALQAVSIHIWDREFATDLLLLLASFSYASPTREQNTA